MKLSIPFRDVFVNVLKDIINKRVPATTYFPTISHNSIVTVKGDTRVIKRETVQDK